MRRSYTIEMLLIPQINHLIHLILMVILAILLMTRSYQLCPLPVPLPLTLDLPTPQQSQDQQLVVQLNPPLPTRPPRASSKLSTSAVYSSPLQKRMRKGRRKRGHNRRNLLEMVSNTCCLTYKLYLLSEPPKSQTPTQIRWQQSRSSRLPYQFHLMDRLQQMRGQNYRHNWLFSLLNSLNLLNLKTLQQSPSISPLPQLSLLSHL